MKKIGVLAVALATAFLLVGAANAEMYVEGYLGGSAAADMGQYLFANNGCQVAVVHEPNNHEFHFGYPGTVDASVFGGIKLGTWFVKEGFAGWSGYPDWCKYFGFYTDFSYRRLDMPAQRLSGVNYGPGKPYPLYNFNQVTKTFTWVSSPNLISGTISSKGMAATWAFMFAGRYGFLPDSEVPFGRLQPYVAVGPAVMFTTLKPKLQTYNNDPLYANVTGLAMSPGGNTQAAIALAVESGIRYMATKNVSLEISFKYLHAHPTFSYHGINGADNSQWANFQLEPNYNLFSGQVGVAYHF